MRNYILTGTFDDDDQPTEIDHEPIRSLVYTIPRDLDDEMEDAMRLTE